MVVSFCFFGKFDFLWIETNNLNVGSISSIASKAKKEIVNISNYFKKYRDFLFISSN